MTGPMQVLTFLAALGTGFVLFYLLPLVLVGPGRRRAARKCAICQHWSDASLHNGMHWCPQCKNYSAPA